jgi:MoxR-like ATPase
MTLEEAQRVAEIIRTRIQYDVMGRDEVIELALVSLLSGGHMLLEDYPGSGKTTLAKALGESIKLGEESERSLIKAPFRRVQFTPDMLPSDITGVMVFDGQKNDFYFRQGPVFSFVLLVDEINRTSPKVQSAMLECMAEGQVTIDNQTYQLDDLFFVIATQNPLDSVGTYPLPVAQLDRFLFKVKMDHIDRNSELEVLNAWGIPRERQEMIQVSRDDVVAARNAIRHQVFVHESVKTCLVDFASILRSDKRCLQGVSTRSLVQAIPALQAHAMLAGRDYVSAQDIIDLASYIFAHRLTVIPGVQDVSGLIHEALKVPIEKLSQSTTRET